jgi:hypothetical protein
MAAKLNFHARVTVRAHRAWRSFAASNGVSVSGVVEALGERFETIEGTDTPPAVKRLVKRAREIDAENRKRG